MKHLLPSFLLLTALFTGRAAEPIEKEAWSENVNGLRARLLIAEGKVFAGDHVPEVSLVLDNVSDSGDPMDLDFGAGRALHFEVHTGDGKAVPNKIYDLAIDGAVMGPFRIAIPHGGTLKFPVIWTGYGFKPNFGTMLCFENAIWEIPRGDKTAYFLSATLEVPETPRDPHGPLLWHGTVRLPSVKVPTFK